MSLPSWWPRWPWKTPDADGEIRTYGFELDPVAWQMVTGPCSDTATPWTSVAVTSCSDFSTSALSEFSSSDFAFATSTSVFFDFWTSTFADATCLVSCEELH